jgi:hypothetical protein
LTACTGEVIISNVSFKTSFWLTILFLLIPFLLERSVASPSDPYERVHSLTRPMEFDYVSWTIRAIGVKVGQFALDAQAYLPDKDRTDTVLESLSLLQQINELKNKLNDIYSDPQIADPESESGQLRAQLSELQEQQSRLQPLAEEIIQQQVSEIASESGLALAGQVIPPVLYHTTPPPDALIISPRNVIQLEEDISISPDISVDQKDALEVQVDKSLDVSSLVVEIGGIGLYPTMVMETTDINGLLEVVAHEWVHNYLTLHPLGISYMSSPELRTMNETVATIAGKELGRAVVARYYPQFLPPENPSEPSTNDQGQTASPPVFDFRAEMHSTRITVDNMLANGHIEAAESYMEQRRVFMWENGYHIRKLNQAYFAFYGAYADQPGGATGEDPVGADVRLLRQKSSTLADFINRMAWMWNYEQLQKAVEGG